MITTKEAEFKQFAMSFLESKGFANVQADSHYMPQYQAVCHQMVATFLSKKQFVEETGEINVPETWWDAVKIRFFPERLLGKFPARMTHYKLTKSVYNICPHIKVSGMSSHAKFLFNSEDHEENRR